MMISRRKNTLESHLLFRRSWNVMKIRIRRQFIRKKIFLAARYFDVRLLIDTQFYSRKCLYTFSWIDFDIKTILLTQSQTSLMRVNETMNCYCVFYWSVKNGLRRRALNTKGKLLSIGTRIHIKIWLRKRCDVMESPLTIHILCVHCSSAILNMYSKLSYRRTLEIHCEYAADEMKIYYELLFTVAFHSSSEFITTLKMIFVQCHLRV